MRCRAVALAGVLFAAALSAPSAATEPPRPDRAAARVAAEAGFKALAAGDTATAVEKLRQAEQSFHAPTHVYFLAKALEAQGKLLEARTLYRSLLTEKLASDAPKAFRDALTNASSALLALEPRMPSLRVTVQGAPAGAKVRLTLDGAPFEPSSEPLYVDPGEHVVGATVDGGATASQRVMATAGKAEEPVTLDFAPAAAPPPPVAPAAASSGGSYVPAAIALGVGLVGVGIGIGTGAASLGKVHDLKAACPQNPCSDDHASLADSARALGTVSTVAFIVGGLGLGTGAVLLVVRKSSAKYAPATAVRAAPGSLWLEGAF